MLKTNQEFPPKTSIQIKQDDKFFAKLLSRESSITNPSFRVYYNGSVSVAVPFVWESQPGTPKHAFHDTTLPPLTPPPSYFSHSIVKKRTNKHSSRANLLHMLFSRIISKKTNENDADSSTSSPSSPTPSSSSFSSSNYSFNTPKKQWNEHRRYSSHGSSLDSWKGYEEDCEDEEVVSPTSTLCFSLRRVASSSSRHGGWS